MHKGAFETKGFMIIYILKNNSPYLISVDECIKIVSESKLDFNNFKSLGDLYFPKRKLESTKNVLISLEIVEKRKTSPKAICRTLINLFPTVFNQKQISKLNIKIFLLKNRKRIFSMCFSILGPSCKDKIDELTSLNYSLEEGIKEEDFLNDDIIENDYFQMQLED